MPRRPSLDSLHAALSRLDLKEKRSLVAWLQEAIAIEAAEADLDITPPMNAGVGERKHYEGKLYQQERRRCGKSGCRCEDGNLSEVGHGPYWYAYWKEKGKLRSKYVGRRVPWQE